jgi:hypothetical protein
MEEKKEVVPAPEVQLRVAPRRAEDNHLICDNVMRNQRKADFQKNWKFTESPKGRTRPVGFMKGHIASLRNMDERKAREDERKRKAKLLKAEAKK